MSGGEYDYLCHQLEARGYLKLADLEAMRDRLGELAPDSAAATVTSGLYERLIGPMKDGLVEVWRAVEWFDSGDRGRDQVDTALQEYDDRLMREWPVGFRPARSPAGEESDD